MGLGGTWSICLVRTAAGTSSAAVALDTKETAEAALTVVLGRLGQGQKVDDRQTVADYLDAWLKSKRRLRPSTRASYVDHIERYFKPLLGHLALEALRPEHIEEMVDQVFAQSEETLQPGTTPWPRGRNRWRQ
jgi:hypothetical protein